MPIEYLDSKQSQGNQSQPKVEYLDGNASSGQPEGSAPSMFQGDQDLNNAMKPQTNSPLNLSDNLKLAFADEPGKYNYLKSKYPFVAQDGKGNYLVGKDATTAQPISPEGLTNDLVGKMTRHLGDFNVIANSIAGASLGGIPGAAAGGAAGEFENKQIGKMIGLNTQKSEDQAQDIVISAMASGLGEGAGQLIAKVGNATVKGGMQAIENAMNKTATSPEAQTASKTTLAKIFNFFSGQKMENTLGVFDPELKQAGKTQVESVLGGMNGTDSHLAEISKSILGSFAKQDETLGKAVDVAKDNLMQAGKGKTFYTRPIQDTVYTAMQRLNIINEDGTFNASHGMGTLGSKLKNFWLDLGGKVNAFNGRFEPTEAKATLEKLLSFDTRFKSVYDGINNDLKDVAYSLRYGTKGMDAGKGFEAVGLKPYLGEIADELKVGSYKQANDAFSKFRNSVEALKGTGIDVENPRNIEGLVKNIASDSPSVRQALAQAQTVLPKSAPNFINDIKRYDIAKSFRNENIRMFRFSMAAGLMGLGGNRGPANEVARLGGAAAFASPIGNRAILMNYDKLANIMPALSPDMQGFLMGNPLIARTATQSAARTLSQLLLKQKNNGKNK